MEYEKKSFSVPVGSKKYRDNWDNIFGNKREDEYHLGDCGLPNCRFVSHKVNTSMCDKCYKLYQKLLQRDLESAN